MSLEFGIGAYSLPEAGKLIGVPAKTLRRWLLGYTYDHHGPEVQQPPLWTPQYDLDEDETVIGFRDLVEARLVRQLRQRKIGLQTIRKCILAAQEIVQDDHPFSTSQFKTEGKRIFLEISKTSGEVQLIDLVNSQHVLRDIVEKSLLGLEFEDGVAAKWWPVQGSNVIVIDPHRAFGQPILARTGTTTRTISLAAVAEGSLDRVAKLYGVEVRAVRAAVQFERDLAKGKLAA